MKFLSKTESSEVSKRKLIYKKNSAKNNHLIKELLLEEQKHFCAYTEKYVDHLDSSEVEHFNASKKYKDDHFNYYAVIRSANLYKKDEKYVGASFFESLFFQYRVELEARIRYIDGFYEEIEEKDQEANDLIDFLGFNNSNLYQQRKKHIKRLKETFKDASYSKEECIQYFRKYKEELSFITAIEIELELDLAEFYT